MALSKDIKIGDDVWIADRSEPQLGKVIDFNVDSETNLICVKSHREYKVFDLRSPIVFLTKKEAMLYLAKKKQDEAADLLKAAASLFSQAGNL